MHKPFERCECEMLPPSSMRLCYLCDSRPASGTSNHCCREIMPDPRLSRKGDSENCGGLRLEVPGRRVESPQNALALLKQQQPSRHFLHSISTPPQEQSATSRSPTTSIVLLAGRRRCITERFRCHGRNVADFPSPLIESNDLSLVQTSEPHLSF